VFACLVAAALAVPVPWKNCGSASDIIKVQTVDASAWPVARGKPETVTVLVNVGQPITGGTYELKISFDGLPLVDKKGNLRELNISLPIPAGPWSKNLTIAVPSFIPPGTASAHIVMKDDGGRTCVCVNVDIPFKISETEAEDLAAIVHDETNVPIPYKNCGKAGDKLTITRADASIWPPKVGQKISLQLNGTLSQDISGGKYEAKVKLMGIQIIDQKGTIEDIAKKANFTLPIKAGNYGFWKTETIPSWVPKADLEVWVQAFNSKGDEIVCLDITAKLS